MHTVVEDNKAGMDTILPFVLHQIIRAGNVRKM
jgi:hypothetical protein